MEFQFRQQDQYTIQDNNSYSLNLAEGLENGNLEDINLQTKLKRKKNAEYQEAHRLRKKEKQQAEFQRLLSEKDEKIAQLTAENAKLQELVKNLQEANKVSGKSLKKISTLFDLQNVSAVEEEHEIDSFVSQKMSSESISIEATEEFPEVESAALRRKKRALDREMFRPIEESEVNLFVSKFGNRKMKFSDFISLISIDEAGWPTFAEAGNEAALYKAVFSGLKVLKRKGGSSIFPPEIANLISKSLRGISFDVLLNAENSQAWGHGENNSSQKLYLFEEKAFREMKKQHLLELECQSTAVNCYTAEDVEAAFKLLQAKSAT